MSILKRTVFYDKAGGIIRFWDWALATTTIGVCAEPFLANSRSIDAPVINFDPTDECARIDEMKEADVRQSLLLLSGGNHRLHGGGQLPRTGR
ncbi:MAG: hypothetical protein QMD11_02705 [Smithella sp.]|nr:hypothetical protein [Smithella sp.]